MWCVCACVAKSTPADRKLPPRPSLFLKAHVHRHIHVACVRARVLSMQVDLDNNVVTAPQSQPQSVSGFFSSSDVIPPIPLNRRKKLLKRLKVRVCVCVRRELVGRGGEEVSVH